MQCLQGIIEVWLLYKLHKPLDFKAFVVNKNLTSVCQNAQEVTIVDTPIIIMAVI